MRILTLTLCLWAAPLAEAEPAAPAPPAAPAACPDSLGPFLQVQGFSAIELSQNTAKQFEVEAKLNGSQTLLLLVDTGSTMTLLDRDKLEDAGLEFEKTDVRLSGFGGEQRLYSAQIANLAIGSAETGPMTIFGADLSSLQETQRKYGSRPIDGVIGSDFLSRYSAVIEIKHSMLYLRTH